MLSDDLQLHNMIDAMEVLYACVFTNCDANLAHVELLARRGKEFDWRTFVLGLRVGTVILLIVWALWDTIVDAPAIDVDDKYHESVKRSLPVFRAIGGLSMLPWLWAMDVVVWRRLRVNYMFLLDCDVKVSQQPYEVRCAPPPTPSFG
jgi:hypothetical protein